MHGSSSVPQDLVDKARTDPRSLMGDVKVGEGASIRRAIIDKHVRIPPGVIIGEDPEEDARRFTVTSNGISVVPRGLAF